MKSQRKVILQVVGAMNMGGAETFLMNVLRNINHEKYRLIFLCYLDGKYDYANEIEKLGGRIIRIPDTRITNPIKFIHNIEKIIESEKVDVVHSHVDLSSGYAMLAAKNAGVKIRIAHAHSASVTISKNIVRRIWFNILKKIMNHYASKSIACGADAGEFMFGKNHFQIINNGIDDNRFRFNAKNRAKIRRNLEIGMDDKVFLHVGRFEAVKNHEFLIDVFNSYYALDKSAKLILLGDGRLFNIIKKKINELGLCDVVYLLGKQSNTEDYYSASDLFLMPSFYEGLPVTLIEAQTNGLVCLVSDKIDKMVNYGIVDFYSLNNTPDEWAVCIQKINCNRQSVNKLLAKEYDIKETTKILEGLYEAR